MGAELLRLDDLAAGISIRNTSTRTPMLVPKSMNALGKPMFRRSRPDRLIGLRSCISNSVGFEQQRPFGSSMGRVYSDESGGVASDHHFIASQSGNYRSGAPTGACS